MERLNLYTVLRVPNNLPSHVKKRDKIRRKKIVVISPHSDDVSVAVGGTITTLAKSNTIIPVLFFSGHRGVKGKKREQSIKIRRKEMQRESRILKIKDPVFLDLESYDKEASLILEEDIIKVENFLIKHDPDIIFLPKKDDSHPRHKLATSLVLKALKTPFLRKEEEREPTTLFFYESPWSLFNAFEFNTCFFFSKKEIQNQLRGVKVHKSQIQRTSFDRATESLAILRGSIIPEQRILGYSEDASSFNNTFAEVFLVHGDKH